MSTKHANEGPLAVYAGILVDGNDLHIAIKNGDLVSYKTTSPEGTNTEKNVLEYLEAYEIRTNNKIVAAGIVKNNDEINFKDLSSNLWLKLDIVPYTFTITEGSYKEKTERVANLIADRFDPQQNIDILYGENRAIHPHRLTGRRPLRDIVSKEQYEHLKSLAKEFNTLGGRIAFISATPQGGGVALMRHALIRLLHQFNVDAHWYVLIPDTRVFSITKKKFHNVLQGVTKPPPPLTKHDKELFEKWTAKNARKFTEAFTKASVVVIDDPQPSGLIPYIKEVNPKAKIIYRSHIQVDASLIADPSTVQAETWNYLWNNISLADIFVSHPVRAFVPKNVPKEKVVYAPATTDPLDGLNKPLQKRHKDYYMTLFNQLLLQAGQDPIDPKRPYIIQIARFDPAKGIPDVIEAYRLLCEKLDQKKKPHPQLVLLGHGSIDDPEGKPLYQETIQLIHTEPYKHLTQDIKVARIHASDQILNTLLRNARVALQLSHKEGFEIKVTEAIHKGVPIIAYKSGGIPLQIEDGVTGFLVKTKDVHAVADRLYDLCTDNKLHATISSQAKKGYCRDFFTIGNSITWLYFALQLMKGKKITQTQIRTCTNLPKML